MKEAWRHWVEKRNTRYYVGIIMLPNYACLKLFKRTILKAVWPELERVIFNIP